MNVLAALGRFHPLLVHLPVGLAAFVLLAELVPRLGRAVGRHSGTILGLLALSALAAAGAGWLLADEQVAAAAAAGESGLVDGHRWAGLGFAGACLLAWLARGAARPRRLLLGAALASGALAAIRGAELTHGSDWFEPGASRTSGAAAPVAAAPVAAAPAAAGSETSAPTIPAPEADVPTAHRPEAAALEALRAAFLHVEAYAPDDPRLWVDAGAAAERLDDATARALLAPLGPWIAELSLARSRVSGALLPDLARFPRLESLDLRDTAVDGPSLQALAGHPRLARLSLVRTQVGDDGLAALLSLPALARLSCWGAPLGAEAVARLRAERPGLVVHDGREPEAAALEQEPELRFGPSDPPVNTSCPVTGEPVDPANTRLFEGRVIGFCCGKCPAAFLADPEKYRAALP